MVVNFNNSCSSPTTDNPQEGRNNSGSHYFPDDCLLRIFLQGKKTIKMIKVLESPTSSNTTACRYENTLVACDEDANVILPGNRQITLAQFNDEVGYGSNIFIDRFGSIVGLVNDFGTLNSMETINSDLVINRISPVTGDTYGENVNWLTGMRDQSVNGSLVMSPSEAAIEEIKDIFRLCLVCKKFNRLVMDKLMKHNNILL